LNGIKPEAIKSPLAKKPSTVADVMRVMLMDRYGGGWLDTDVLLLRPLSKSYSQPGITAMKWGNGKIDSYAVFTGEGSKTALGEWKSRVLEGLLKAASHPDEYRHTDTGTPVLKEINDLYPMNLHDEALSIGGMLMRSAFKFPPRQKHFAQLDALNGVHFGNSANSHYFDHKSFKEILDERTLMSVVMERVFYNARTM